LHQQLFPSIKRGIRSGIRRFFLKLIINKKYDCLHQQLFPSKKRGIRSGIRICKIYFLQIILFKIIYNCFAPAAIPLYKEG
jgi:hypothetical protein